jgi:hypothetical protein
VPRFGVIVLLECKVRITVMVSGEVPLLLEIRGENI